MSVCLCVCTYVCMYMHVCVCVHAAGCHSETQPNVFAGGCSSMCSDGMESATHRPSQHWQGDRKAGWEERGSFRSILFLKRSETDITVQSGCYDTVFCNHKYVCKFVIRMKTHYNCKHDEGTSTPEPRYKTRLPGPQVTPPGAGQKCSSRDYATPGIRTAPSQHAQVVPVHISVREAPLGS